MADKKTDHTPTQARRRTLYGLNVAIAAAVAVAIAVLLNVLVFWGYDRADPAVKEKYLRFDLTHTRAYSLSPQSLKVLSELEGDHEIITLFRSQNREDLARVRALTDQYGGRTGKVRVQHINPDFDVVGRDGVFARLRERFADQLAPAEEAIGPAIQTAERLAVMFDEVRQSLMPLLEEDARVTGPSRVAVRTVVTESVKMSRALRDSAENLKVETGATLTGFDGAVTGSVATLSAAEILLNEVVTYIGQVVKVPDMPIKVKEQLFGASETMTQAKAWVSDALSRLAAVERVEAYESARATLLSEESVLVMSPDSAIVIPAREMVREPDLYQRQRQQEEGVSREPPFIGEERLTGALVSLGFIKKPLVVFLNGNPQGAMGRRGFSHIADRARAANFEVEIWNALGTPSPYSNQVMQAGPIPEPEPGQRAVYVVLPFVPNPDPVAAVPLDRGKQAVGNALRDKLAEGHGALVLLFPNFAAAFTPEDPVVLVLEDWGIYPQTDRLILTERRDRDGEFYADRGFELSRWPEGTPIAEAMRGRTVRFGLASPIQTGPQGNKPNDDGPPVLTDIRYNALAVIEEPRMWTVGDIRDPRDLGDAAFDPDASAPQYTVAVAAEHDGQRMIVFAEPGWPSNEITTLGTHPAFGIGEGLATVQGGSAVFPGNTELFINSIYWLAGLDGMIAAGASSKDTPRIGEITITQSLVYWTTLPLGLPLVVLIGGLIVWRVRRRG